MARGVKASKSARPGSRVEKPAMAGTKTPSRPRTVRAAAALRPPAAPKVSKDELRAQLDKLERANATLRARNREAQRAAKAAAAELAELHDRVAELEQLLAAAAPPEPVVRKPRRPRVRGQVETARASEATGKPEADAATPSPDPATPSPDPDVEPPAES
jgi:hypothetical protein